MGVRIEEFGTTKDGFQAKLYILENENGTIVKVSDFGAVIVSVIVKDRDGKAADIALGYPDVTGYETNGQIGRASCRERV